MGTQIRLKTCEDMSALWISFIKLGQTLTSHKPLKQDIFKMETSFAKWGHLARMGTFS